MAAITVRLMVESGMPLAGGIVGAGGELASGLMAVGASRILSTCAEGRDMIICLHWFERCSISAFIGRNRY